MGQHLQWQELIAGLPDDLPLENLKTIICPVIADAPESQKRIYELFDQALTQVRAVNVEPEITLETVTPATRWKWWILGLSVALLAISIFPIWDWYQHIGKIEPTFFTVEQGATQTICINEEKIGDYHRIAYSQLCENQLGSSIYGSFSISGICLTYTAKDSVGSDSVCVELHDNWGRKFHTSFLATIPPVKEQPVEKPDTTAPEAPLFTYNNYPFKNDIRALAITPLTPLEAFYQKYAIPLKSLFTLLSALLLWAILQYRQNKRQKLIAELESSDKPPYVWNIQIDGVEDIEVNEAYFSTLHLLKQRTTDQNFRLDLPKTIDATIKKGGMAEFQYRQLTRPAEYLLLIDRQSASNHRAQLFNWLYRQFKAQEVLVERFYYDGDIRLCKNEAFPYGISLKELQHKYYNARLLILGTGYPLISALSGRLSRWTEMFNGWAQRSILSPRPISQWGRKEAQLSSLFAVLPASMQGLNYLADQLDAGEELEQHNWLEKIKDAANAPIELSGSLIESLQAHFSERQVKWIAACAIYPSLHWDLTLFLGKQLSSEEQPLLTIDNLMEINRLPWFVDGEMPKAVRLQLLNWLETNHPDLLQHIREQLHQLLQQKQPPKDSAAWEDYRMNIALNEWLITKDPKRKKELEKQIADELDRGVEPDITVVKYLDREQTALDFIVPDRWKKYLHKGGHSGLGLKDFWKDVLYWALPFWLIACALVWWLPTEWGSGCEGEVYTYFYQGENLDLCISRPQNRILLHEYLARDAFVAGDSTKIDSLTQVVQDILALGIDPIRNAEEATVEIRLDSAGMIYFKNLAVDFYNKGVDIYLRADSLENKTGPEYRTLKAQTCYYFNQAATYDQWEIFSHDVEIPENVDNIQEWRRNNAPVFANYDPTFFVTGQWCDRPVLPENVQLEGVVYQAGSNQPLEQVIVSYQGQETRSSRTGGYALLVKRNVLGSKLLLRFSKPGYQVLEKTFFVALADSAARVLDIAYMQPAQPEQNIPGQGPPPEPVVPEVFEITLAVFNATDRSRLTGVRVNVLSQNYTNTSSNNYVVSIPKDYRAKPVPFTFSKAGYEPLKRSLTFDPDNLSTQIILLKPLPLTLGSEYNWLNGRWKAENILQQSSNTTWSIRLEIDLAKKLFRADYFDIPCKANWVPERIEGNVLFFRETIIPGSETGTRACEDKMQIKVERVNESSLRVTRYTVNGDYGAEAVLRSESITANPPSTADLPIPEMVFVKGGTFTMGCLEKRDGQCEDDETPAHEVRLDDFYIGKYEVTNEEYAAFLNAKGNQEEGGTTWIYLKRSSIEQIEGQFQPKQGQEKHPVMEVSWYGAQAYAQWLSESTGNPYRLPTEAEWEYAARGGSRSQNYRFAGSNDLDEVAWYSDNAGSRTHPIGGKRNNELGIYDMSGNVWEWCEDWYDENYYQRFVKEGGG